MSLFVFAKEWIVINEEIVIFFSFFVVLYILVTNFGGELANQFNEQKNKIATSYSQGSQEEEKAFSKIINLNIKRNYYIISLVLLEAKSLKKLLRILDSYLAQLFLDLKKTISSNNIINY